MKSYMYVDMCIYIYIYTHIYIYIYRRASGRAAVCGRRPPRWAERRVWPFLRIWCLRMWYLIIIGFTKTIITIDQTIW